MNTAPDSTVLAIATKLNVLPAVIEGVLGDLAKMGPGSPSKTQLAERWGLSFGELNTVRSMGKVVIAEVRDGMVGKKLALANKLDDIVMDGLNDPIKRDKLGLKDAAQMSKQFTDSALNLANGQVGAPATQINIGDVRVLIERRERGGVYVPVRDRLMAEGRLKPAKVIEV